MQSNKEDSGILNTTKSDYQLSYEQIEQEILDQLSREEETTNDQQQISHELTSIDCPICNHPNSFIQYKTLLLCRNTPTCGVKINFGGESWSLDEAARRIQGVREGHSCNGGSSRGSNRLLFDVVDGRLLGMAESEGMLLVAKCDDCGFFEVVL